MMKAGSVGSIPNDTATQEKTSHPLYVLLMDIGDAVFSLNTMVVGLDAVEHGYSKPSGLDISWNPKDRQIAARKSRKFIIEAVLVRVAEAVKQYALALSSLPRLDVVATKWNGNTNTAKKIEDVFTEILKTKNYLVVAVILLTHWRNRIIHKKSNAALTKTESVLLCDHGDELSLNYKGLKACNLLCHFDEGRPTLKDVSSLIAMSINLAREVDKSLYDSLDKQDIDAWLMHYDLLQAINRIKAETSPKKIDDAIKRMFKSRAPQLYEAYEKYYQLN